jgi:hypothetical protein
MNEQSRIKVDDSLPATLHDRGEMTHCHTLQEAKIAWAHLPPDRQKNATIQVDVKGGAVYTASEIERLYRTQAH